MNNPNSNSELVKFEKPKYKQEEFYICRNILMFLIYLGSLIAFLVLGFKDNAWKTSWIIFIFALVINSIFTVIETGKLNDFNIVFLVLGVYLILGLEYSLWHPFWYLFLIIPVFYIVGSLIDKYRHG